MTRSPDVIIIGAGSTGCVLARRLTDAGAGVLLLEAAATATTSNVRTPAFIARCSTARSTGATAPSSQPNPQQPPHLPVARPLPRRHQRDQLQWSTCAATGATTITGATSAIAGWGYDEVLPYFRRSEGNDTHGAPFHGTDGPLTVSSYRPRIADPRRLHPGRATGRLPLQPRCHRRRAGGRGPLPGHHRPQGPRFGRGNLPAPGDGPAQPPRPDPRACHPHPDRGWPCLGRGLRPHGPVAGRPGGRSHPLRRRDQQPADPDALRHRPARPPRGPSASRWNTTCPASASTCRTTSRSSRASRSTSPRPSTA